jgi:hypothetical protein
MLRASLSTLVLIIGFVASFIPAHEDAHDDVAPRNRRLGLVRPLPRAVFLLYLIMVTLGDGRLSSSWLCSVLESGPTVGVPVYGPFRDESPA